MLSTVHTKPYKVLELEGMYACSQTRIYHGTEH